MAWSCPPTGDLLLLSSLGDFRCLGSGLGALAAIGAAGRARGDGRDQNFLLNGGSGGGLGRDLQIDLALAILDRHLAGGAFLELLMPGGDFVVAILEALGFEVEDAIFTGHAMEG